MNAYEQSRRDNIIFGVNHHPLAYAGGAEDFEHLKLSQLKLLIDNHYIDLKSEHNSSPTVQEFYDFMKKHPNFQATGYAINHRRDDCRVSLDGVQCQTKELTKEEINDFVEMFRDADEFNIHTGYAWYD
jgi:hypothetical protein